MRIHFFTAPFLVGGFPRALVPKRTVNMPELWYNSPHRGENYDQK